MKATFVTPNTMKEWIETLDEEEKETYLVVVVADSPNELRLLEEIVATLHDNNFMR